MDGSRDALLSSQPITEDSLRPLLRTETLGRVIYAFATCDSTNALARRLIEGGPGAPPGGGAAPHGALVVADWQRAGRGRGGRVWRAGRGKSLLFSLVLHSKEEQDAGLITLAASVAVAVAARNLGVADCAIKWPNDVVDGAGRKMCGILCERARRPDDANAFVAGIGLNVNQGPEDFPPQLKKCATSVRMALGRPVSRLNLLADLLAALEKSLALPRADLLTAWRRRCTTLGRIVRVRLTDRFLTGQAVGLESDGRLVVRTETGELETLYSGDVEELRIDEN
ncbi:MAG TPA: biotin--[acetyl-CoA-carboxylase] ligase [Sumerlaeia bacterium]|nr:biotin--[acetyl-CoA-carboxylase] ligase [Sumerlaeia bacterium]